MCASHQIVQGENVRITTVTFPASTLSRNSYEERKQFIHADFMLRQCI